MDEDQGTGPGKAKPIWHSPWFHVMVGAVTALCAAPAIGGTFFVLVVMVLPVSIIYLSLLMAKKVADSRSEFLG